MPENTLTAMQYVADIRRPAVLSTKPATGGRANPHAALRATGPVHRIESPSGVPRFSSSSTPAHARAK